MASAFTILIAAFSFLSLTVAAPQGSQRRSNIANQITFAPEVNHSLLVCNAYAYKEPLEVFRMRSQMKLTAAPIQYKGCSELSVPLLEGDKLDFKAGLMDVGTFTATGLPKRPANLLLVPHRRDNNYMSITFESHAFSQLQTAQVAVVDAYRGRKDGVVTIMDDPIAQEKNNGNLRDSKDPSSMIAVDQRVETLKYKSVVALNSGKYQLALKSKTAGDSNRKALDVPPGPGKYVIMRVGVDDGRKDDSLNPFPEELILFQQHSAAGTLYPQLVTLLLAILGCFNTMRQ